MAGRMYLRHFGLEHRPFTITPDPRFLYLSERYREALAHLSYGVGEGGGFVLLTGEVGTGKTTLCRSMLEQLPPDVDAALVINPSLGADELLHAICDELGVSREVECKGMALRGRLNDHLLAVHAAGRRTVLIIDEAQLLGPEALEQVRLLTNLETHTDKLLQVILVGQPELRELLARPGLRQLAQRITARYHLEPLARGEIDAYIDHRLELAGASAPLFTPGAKGRVHRASCGIPRLVNSLCDRALLGAFAQGVPRVDTAIATRAAAEVLGLPARGRGWPTWAGVLLVACAALGGWLYFTHAPPPPGSASTGEEAAVTTGPMVEKASTEPAASSTAVPAQISDANGVAATAPAIDPGPKSPVIEVPDPLATALFDSRDAALDRLATLWGTPSPSITTTCDTPPTSGLGCFTAQGAWAALGALDRPALLHLSRQDDRIVYAVLAGSDGPRVTLLTPDGERLEVARDSLLADWYGRFELLWSSPGTTLLSPGDRGPAVLWLRARLATDATPTDPALFDPDLAARVLAFQQLHGLKPDGLVGRQTMIQLDLLAGPGPRLATGG